MRFVHTDEQRAFASSLESLLAASDPVSVARAWAEGDTAPGLALWSRLADQGVTALVAPEEYGGMGASPVELTIAFEALGRHAVPGPWVESASYLPLALGDADVLGALAQGAIGSVAVPPHVPYALDGDSDVAEHLYLVDGPSIHHAVAVDQVSSVDRTRRLATCTATEETCGRDLDAAFDLAVLATAAQLLGAGERVLTDSVAYVKQRRQFGREIGSYQAIKHALADVRIALDFARPLVDGVALGAISASAAKVACADAAYRASRTGLQTHGAIGYTAEFDLSVWITKIRALITAWGTPAYHRSRLLAELTR